MVHFTLSLCVAMGEHCNARCVLPATQHSLAITSPVGPGALPALQTGTLVRLSRQRLSASSSPPTSSPWRSARSRAAIPDLRAPCAIPATPMPSSSLSPALPAPRTGARWVSLAVGAAPRGFGWRRDVSWEGSASAGMWDICMARRWVAGCAERGSDARSCPWAVCHRVLFNLLCHNISQPLICLSS